MCRTIIEHGLYVVFQTTGAQGGLKSSDWYTNHASTTNESIPVCKRHVTEHSHCTTSETDVEHASRNSKSSFNFGQFNIIPCVLKSTARSCTPALMFGIIHTANAQQSCMGLHSISWKALCHHGTCFGRAQQAHPLRNKCVSMNHPASCPIKLKISKFVFQLQRRWSLHNVCLHQETKKTSCI